MNRRKGFQLVEILLAVAIASGPLLVAFGLIQQSVTGARSNVDLASARQALGDLSELLLGETMDSLREIGQAGKLNDLLKSRIDRLPLAARQQYSAQVASLNESFRCSLEEDAGEVKGLARLTLAVSTGKTSVKLSRYFRPESRMKPAR